MKRFIVRSLIASAWAIALSLVSTIFCAIVAPNLITSGSVRADASQSGLTSRPLLALATENILPAETARSLPVANLVCVPKPASDAVVNVKEYGAKGDGKSDDTKAIQKVLNGASESGGTVLIPAGTYLINTDTPLRPGNNMTIKMEEGAVLKAIPTSKEGFSIIWIKDVANVNIAGGIILGERYGHKGNAGEWGMGIRLAGSKNVVIENVISKNNWGDGFYIGNNAVHSTFCGVIADNNRRQGMAIISADGIVIDNSTFQRGNGYVGCGLDIEPNTGETVVNVDIINSRFIFNQDSGLVSGVPQAHKEKAFIRNSKIVNNLFMKNGKQNGYTAGILISQVADTKIHNNIVKENVQNGILVVKSANSQISGNLLKDNGNKKEKYYGSGIFLEDSTGNMLENNTVSGSAKYDIYDENGKNHVLANQAEKVHKSH